MRTARRPPEVRLLLFAVALFTLIAAIGSFALMASSWDMGGMMRSDHMGRMMSGGGRNSSGDPSRQGSSAETVIVEDSSYSPGNLQVPVGATVTWVNRDSAPHSATDARGAWDTGLLVTGQDAKITFGSSGTFDYYCTVHPNMRARLVVR